MTIYANNFWGLGPRVAQKQEIVQKCASGCAYGRISSLAVTNISKVCENSKDFMWQR